MKIFVADVGGTFIKFALMNESAEILTRGKISTPKKNRKEFFETLANLYKKNPADGISLSLPGIVDSERGICVKSVSLNFTNENVAEELKKICGVRVSVENDSNCAALAEVKIGSLADVQDGFVMVFGTMVGGTFIKNKKIHRGKNNSSGEISFFKNNFSEEKSLGDIISVPKLLKTYAEKKSLAEEVSGEKFFESVAANDKIAVECLKNFTEKIAVQIFNIQCLLDVEKFSIGGGISSQKIFIEWIQRKVDELCEKNLANIEKIKIVPCKFFNDANLIGALFNFFE